MVDSRIVQVLDFPALQIDVDRQRAARLGIAQRDVANNMLTSLAGSALVGPTYYLNPQNRRELHRRGADAGRKDRDHLRHSQSSRQPGVTQHLSGHPGGGADIGARRRR